MASAEIETKIKFLSPGTGEKCADCTFSLGDSCILETIENITAMESPLRFDDQSLFPILNIKDGDEDCPVFQQRRGLSNHEEILEEDKLVTVRV